MRHIDVEAIDEQGVSHNRAIMKRVILANGQVNNLTNFATSRFAPGQVAPGHSHEDMSEVFYCLSGRGNVQLESESVSLSQGECVVIEPGEWHELSNAGEDEWTLVYFGILSHAPAPNVGDS